MTNRDDIAVIGMACRFPGANTVEAFWDLLWNGVDPIGEVPASRWKMDSVYDPDPEAAGKLYCRYGGFLQDVDQFDAQLFGIAPREAARVDPQQRILLEVAWEALENAGQPPKDLKYCHTGVFVGVAENDYGRLVERTKGVELQHYDATGSGFCFVSGRLSHVLGLTGPNLSVDTGCSSSLVATHLAISSLRLGECDMALACGVQLRLAVTTSISLARARALAPDGRCKTFDAAADGFGRSEGCGVLVLKRLSDARRAGDSVLALIRGSAMNHDGPSSGFTVPSENAQVRVIRSALGNAGLEPAEVGYIEAHGTGTALGDPIEVSALTSVFGESGPPLFLGSVKSNIGHTEAAAGIAGLMKVVLAFGHDAIPPNLHLRDPNPLIPWQGLRFEVARRAQPWPSDVPRVAGVSSFGMSGTNAHAIVSAVPLPERTAQTLGEERSVHVLALSGKSEGALEELAERYRRYLDGSPAEVGDICYTASTGRSHFEHRMAVTGANVEELREGLKRRSGGTVARKSPRMAMVFGGEATGYAGMGGELYRTQPTFRRAVDECRGQERGPEAAVFAVEYGLAELWRSWGIEPVLLWGEGVGAYVAGCVAGVWSLEEALEGVCGGGVKKGGVGRIRLLEEHEGMGKEEALRRLCGEGVEFVIELSPRPALVEAARKTVPNGRVKWLSSIAPGREWRMMAESLGELYESGATVNWNWFERDYVGARRKVALPLYPFQRKRYWIPSPAPSPERNSSGSSSTLLGSRMRAAIHHTTLFESELSVERLPLLLEHRVRGSMVVPGALHLAMVAGAVQAELGNAEVVLEDIVFPELLEAMRDRSSTVQVSITGGAKSPQLEFKVVTVDGDRVVVHATGSVVRVGNDPTRLQHPLESLQPRITNSIPREEFYRRLEARGIALGPSFRWISSIWTNDEEVLAEVQPPADSKALPDVAHPGLLDACFQVTDALADDQPRLPFSVQRLAMNLGAIRSARWIYGHRIGAAAWDIALLDQQGLAVAELSHFEDRVARGWRDWLLEVGWEEDRPPAAAVGGGSSWLILGESRQRTELAEALRGAGDRKVFEAGTEDGLDMENVVFLAGSDLAAEAPDRAEALSISLLALTQALASRTHASRLWIVTRNGQAVIAGEAVHPEQSGLWGLANAISAEHPELRTVCIDIDGHAASFRALCQELKRGDADRIAVRCATGGDRGLEQVRRYQRKFVPFRPVERSRPCRLTLDSYGTPDNLRIGTHQRRAPGAGEVEIEVRAASLNFRDVLTVLGMLRAQYEQDLNIREARDVLLGLDCAGNVVRVGASVREIRVGAPVMAMGEGCLATHVTVQASQVSPLPAGVDFLRGAALPLAFLTAQYGLGRAAKLRRGERVLIHAAAGGVGQAAVQIARVIGAEIFATASPEKHCALRESGIAHLMNSRNLDFARTIRDATAGRGVDVVFNSLNGAFIEGSARVLALGGRFVEIGKIGAWDAERMKEFRPDIGYFPFDLGTEAAKGVDLIPALFRELGELFSAGTLVASEPTVFALEKAAEGFRLMQQAKHTGKLVIAFPKPGKAFRADGSYLITGGCGALGLLVARRFAREGAGCLILASRTLELSDEARETIAEIGERGVRVRVVQADISNHAEATQLLETCRKAAPLRGIVHAAGVLEDGVLAAQTPERFREVLKPKVRGAWNLHQLTRNDSLDFFVAFSSVAALLQTGGQGNYAAANAFLDGLMHQRRAMGLPGLSIDWAAWADTGMAARTVGRHPGLRDQAIPPDEGLDALIGLLGMDKPQVVVLPVDGRDRKTVLGEAAPVFVADIQQQLRAAPRQAQSGILGNWVRAEVAKILGLGDAAGFDGRTSFSDAGMDSLMTVELRNRFQEALQIALSSTVLFDYPNLDSLCPFLLRQMGLSTEPAAERGETEGAALSAEQLRAVLDEELRLLAVRRGKP